MKLKIILIAFLAFISCEVKSQTPSINEAKSEAFLNNRKFKNEFTKTYNVDLNALDKKKERDLKVAGLEETEKAGIKQKYEQDKADIKRQKDSLESDRSYFGYEAYYNAMIKRKVDSINTLYEKVEKWTYEDQTNENLKELKTVYDSIYKKKIKLQKLITERDEKLAFAGSFNWFMPTFEKGNRKQFFHDMYNNETGKPIFLNSFALNGNGDATSVQNEVVTDNMWALRVTFGSVLSLASGKAEPGQTAEEVAAKTKKETEQEALNRLLNGGGNFYLEFILPLATTNQNNGDQITSYTYATARGAMDIESISSNIDTSTGNGTIGVSEYFGISSDSKKFNFFLQGNANFTFGTTDFYNNLGLMNAKPFFNGRVLAGVTILNNFRISAAVWTFGSDEKVRSNKVTVGVQILPGL
ncbi:hypothetical protein B4N84_19530 [Flavobacterium sp. IR1]|nr:hypothetical protein B4N84_19530 [Flavobacterium sp. IR1]